MNFVPPSKPLVALPIWAIVAGNSDIKDPGPARKATGIQYNDTTSNKLGEKFPYQFDNYLRNQVGQWASYSSDFADYVTGFFNNNNTFTNYNYNYTSIPTDSYSSFFINMSLLNGKQAITSPNNPTTLFFDALLASRYPQYAINIINLATGDFTCPLSDYFNVVVSGSIYVTTDYTKDVIGAMGANNSVTISVYVNGVEVSSNILGGENIGMPVDNTHTNPNPLLPIYFNDIIYCKQYDVINVKITNNTMTTGNSLCPMYYGFVNSTYSSLETSILWNLI